MGARGRTRLVLVIGAATATVTIAAAGVALSRAPDTGPPGGHAGGSTAPVPDDPGAGGPAPADAAAAAALVAAWERSLTGSFTAVSSFERRLAGGRRVSSEVVVAQRPPDRLVRDGAAATGRLGGRRVTCSAAGGRPLGCTDGGAAPAYEHDVARELAAVRRLVVGADAPYAVTTQRGGCFGARLRVWSPAPAWGTAAVFCFDPATGAPSLTAITRPEGVDRTVARDIRPVGDADLAVG